MRRVDNSINGFSLGPLETGFDGTGSNAVDLAGDRDNNDSLGSNRSRRLRSGRDILAER